MKLLVVDDHPLILEALERYVASAEPDWTLVTAGTRDDALRELALHPDCDAVLLDLALPGTRGLAFLVELRRDRPRLPIVVLSATHDRATIDGALAAGARGFIAKRADAAEVVARGASSRLRGGRPVASASRPALAPGRPTWPIGCRSASRSGSPTCCGCSCRASRTSSSAATSRCPRGRSRCTSARS